MSSGDEWAAYDSEVLYQHMIGVVFRHHINYIFSYDKDFPPKQKRKDYTNRQPKKSPHTPKKKWQCQMKGKKVYWGVLFYSGWKFWLARINSLLASVFSLLFCWHRLPHFTSVAFNLKLCLYGFVWSCSCSRLLQKLCVCLFLASDPVPSGACGNTIKLSPLFFLHFLLSVSV